MNYTEIVLNGYCNPDSRGYLDNYFFRQFKKAQKDFYEADEFFSGCFRVTRFFEAEMNKRRIERITELYQIIDWHKRGMRGDSDTPKEPTTEDLKLVNILKEEIEGLSCENFPFNLFGFNNNKYSGQLWFNELKFIEANLEKAKKKALGVVDVITKEPETISSITKKESQKIKLSIKQVALKYIYEGKSITRQNSNSIIKEYGHTSGDKLYNEYTRYSSKTNRIANEETEQKLKNKIKLIESVISLLSIENQEKPKKEITDLKAKLIID
ncbi:hypothetical protein [Tenacibaculum finnmarkense]|uniref:hypothetical protein n=1 Tax=Tenacibaculum finnmarkense TaxID=2781243 RepID=UPI001E36EA75|nr:hypothetical protein [Tenacibaculum finnmarkense]MCD8409671.1 hypothetical protein [Tenacibaculum finnmarkense genomovar ulcerans]MCD8444300.1 hypothetical protein [Tenacibaculum finnmarkense genomovar ulcerans]MCG8858898.1 hypothetical protein [Tenacibaculum finnmarkense]